MATRRMRPTLKHRPALTPGILGTVYGINAAGVARYFDYDWPAARAWAGVDPAADNRSHVMTAHDRLLARYVTNDATEADVRPGKWALWVPR